MCVCVCVTVNVCLCVYVISVYGIGGWPQGITHVRQALCAKHDIISPALFGYLFGVLWDSHSLSFPSWPLTQHVAQAIFSHLFASVSGVAEIIGLYHQPNQFISGVMVHTSKPIHWRPRLEDYEFKTSLCYTGKYSLKTKQTNKAVTIITK